MAPLTPHWAQPSHPSIQKVIVNNKKEFTTKSISTVTLAPYALVAKLSFPPCTKADKPTYATVQMGWDEHLDLNSDLVYINHSCDPSLVSSVLPPFTSGFHSHPTLLLSIADCQPSNAPTLPSHAPFLAFLSPFSIPLTNQSNKPTYLIPPSSQQ